MKHHNVNLHIKTNSLRFHKVKRNYENKLQAHELNWKWVVTTDGAKEHGPNKSPNSMASYLSSKHT